MANAHVLIQSQTLGSAVSTVTFSSIPSTYRDLQLVCNFVVSSAVGGNIVINSDTTSGNYPWVQLLGNGSGIGSNGTSPWTNTSLVFTPNSNLNTANPTPLQVSIFDYAQTDKHKSIITKLSLMSDNVSLMAHRWASTSAITRIDVNTNSSTWAAGSTFMLYGVLG
jgi:hypothetical protein